MINRKYRIKKYLIWTIITHLDNILVQNLMWSDQVPSEYWAIAGTKDDYPGISEDLSILYHFDSDAPVQDFSMMVTDLQNHQSLSSDDPTEKLSNKQVNHLNKGILHAMKVFASFGKIPTKKLKSRLNCFSYIRTQKMLNRFKNELPTYTKNQTNKKRAYIKLFTDEATSLRHLPVNKEEAKHAIVQYIDKNFTKVDRILSAKSNLNLDSKISDINDKHIGVNSTVEKILLHHHVITHKQLDKALDEDIDDL